MVRRRRKGFTLMESVLVIAVGLGLMVGGIGLYSYADHHSTVRGATMTVMDVQDQLPSYATAAKDRAAQQGHWKYFANLAGNAIFNDPGWSEQNIVLSYGASARHGGLRYAMSIRDWPGFSITFDRGETSKCSRFYSSLENVVPLDSSKWRMSSACSTTASPAIQYRLLQF